MEKVFVNPNDEDRKHLIGKTARIPVINIDVPIMADEKVDAEKGTGIVMCCTFGDTVDKEWQRKHNLPIKKYLYLIKMVGAGMRSTHPRSFFRLRLSFFYKKHSRACICQKKSLPLRAE